jgi:sulfur-oxidizing protein SoxY
VSITREQSRATSRSRRRGLALLHLTLIHPALRRIVLLAALLAGTAPAVAVPPGWERIAPLRELVGTAVPVAAGISLDLPLVSEDGSAVPLGVQVDSPMTTEQHVRSIHIFAPGNPTPEVAEVYLQPAAGRADLATRVRLNESQTVYVAAVMSDGEVRLAAREVRVTVSGCLGRPQQAVSALETPRVGLGRNPRRDEPVEVRALIDHPMETGLRPDERGGFLPQHIVEQLTVRLADQPVLEARFHRAVSMNPYLRFHVRAVPGELALDWRDDAGATASARETLQPR